MSNDFDVTIIGSGPGGLAALSAIREDYSINMLSDVQLNRASRHIRESNKRSKAKRTICVIDPNPDWLSQWERNFEALDISFLRSPTVAHCCYFDRNALLAYAISQGREDELLESGCSDIKSLKGTILPQVGLWKLPSTKLFIDFSRDLARLLKHKYIQGKVVDIDKDDSLDSSFKITIGGNSEKVISSKSVILATGAVGRPIIPKPIKELSSTRIFQWQQLDQAISSLEQCAAKKRKVLVVGGGLTAVQTAHKVVKKSGAEVVLCSRRDLVERHFDIPVKWFDEREARFHQSQFYFEPEEERLKALKSTRGGGTVPPVYMKKTRALEIRGLITRMTGDVVSITEENDDSLMVTIKRADDSSEETIEIDVIIVACGLKPDCMAHPLVQKIQEKWPIKMTGGFPIVSDELQWTENLHVVGGLSSLSVGPDANNIMGISRAAETVANALNSKNWLRKKESNVLRNPFDVFLDETDVSSDEEE